MRVALQPGRRAHCLGGEGVSEGMGQVAGGRVGLWAAASHKPSKRQSGHQHVHDPRGRPHWARGTRGYAISRYDRLGNTEILKAGRGIGVQYCAASFRRMRGPHLRLRQGPGCESFLGTFMVKACSVLVSGKGTTGEMKGVNRETEDRRENRVELREAVGSNRRESIADGMRMSKQGWREAHLMRSGRQSRNLGLIEA